MRELFETWLKEQFGKSIKNTIKFDNENGYDDEIINAMWIALKT